MENEVLSDEVKKAEESEEKIKKLGEDLKKNFSSLVSEINNVDTNIKDFFLNTASGISELASKMGPDIQEKVGNIQATCENTLNEMLEKFKEPMSTLLEIVQKVVDEISEYLSGAEVTEVLERISGVLNEVIEATGNLVDNILPVVKEMLQWIVDNSEEIISCIVGITSGLMAFQIASTIALVVKKIMEFKEALIATEGVMAAFNLICAGNVFGVIIAAIIGVVAALVTLWNTSDEFRNAVTMIFEAIGDVMKSVLDALITFLTETIPSAFQSLCTFIEGIPQWFVGLWTSIKEAFSLGWEAIVSFFTEQIPAWINSLGEWFSQLPEKVGYALGYALGKVVEFGVSCVTWVTNDLPKIINGIVEWFSKLPENIWKFLSDIITKVGSWGANILQSATTAATNMFNNVVNWFSKLPGNIANFLSNIISSIGTWGGNLITAGMNAASGFVNNIVTAVSSLPGKMLSIGKNIVTGLWDGICNATTWLRDKVNSFCDGIVAGIKDSLGIHSPSRVMRDLVGINIVRGIGVGIETEMPNLNKLTYENISDMSRRMKAVVKFETERVSLNMARGRENNMLTSSVTNNDNGIVQNITFNEPIKSPSETARAIRRAGRELAFG